MRSKFDNGEDPLDPEQQHGGGVMVGSLMVSRLEVEDSLLNLISNKINYLIIQSAHNIYNNNNKYCFYRDLKIDYK